MPSSASTIPGYGPSPDEKSATEFFTTVTRTGTRTGVNRMIVVSIIGIDRFAAD